MAGFGAAPKPGSRQPNRGLGAAAQQRLPSSGRQGPVPNWPLGRPTKRESELWERIWKIPQAVAWERLEWTDAVARYVRVQVVAEKPKAPFIALAEARQMEDRLGLSPLSLLRLRWEIVDEEPAEVDLQVVDVRQRLGA